MYSQTKLPLNEFTTLILKARGSTDRGPSKIIQLQLYRGNAISKTWVRDPMPTVLGSWLHDPTNSSGGKYTFPRRGIVKYKKLRISIELERCRILIVAKPQRQIQAVKGIPIALEKNVAIA
jgi:hypothetical protein